MTDFLNLSASAPSWLTIGVVALMFLMFLRETYPTEVVAMVGVSVLLVTGVLSYDDAVGTIES